MKGYIQETNDAVLSVEESKQQGIFITDFGKEQEIDSVTDMATGKTSSEAWKLPRYGVWVYDSSKHKPQVAETSNDLEYLKKKYNVEKVVKI